MTQMVNRLVEQELVERIYDPSNRRIIKIHLTDKAAEYTDRFLEHDAGCFCPLLEELTEKSIADFKKGLELLIEVFTRISCTGHDKPDSDIVTLMKENSAF